ncbi:MAG: orotate phosphoribosyltransferase [Planctomycetes bacterium]|nr:orotate phosphoribosyltransferase [Planctomycetota bacterium]
MGDFRRDFINFACERGALKFGEFKTKSGRLSPYFFNAGGLYSGPDLLRLGEAYARTLERDLGLDFDILYGPAYKGIPLATAVVMQLSACFGARIDYCFNRKEAKGHGDGGLLVGRVPAAGDRVVLIDDVVTAGTSVRESMEILSAIPGVKVTGMAIALDRREVGKDEANRRSAVREIEEENGFPVRAIASFELLEEMISAGEIAGLPADMSARMAEYRRRYGAEG